MKLDPNAPIVVIGGGVLGISIAAHLARTAQNVTLVTEAALASGASGRSLSWLNSLMAPTSAYHRLRMESLALYREFAQDHPGSEDYLRFDGGVFWPNDPNEPLSTVTDRLDEYSYPYEILDAAAVADRRLGIAPEVVPSGGVLFTDQEGWVDLPSLINVLAAEFRAAGGTVLDNVGKAEPVVEDGRTTGVRLQDGRVLPATAAVLATGPDVPAAVGDLGLTIPDQTPVSVLVRTKPTEASLPVVVNSPRVAVRPAPDEGLVLDKSWAGESIIDQGDDTYSIPEEIVAELMTEASKVIAGHPDLEMDSYGIGRKPIPGDGLPVVGEVSGASGCHMVFTHSGATLAFILGKLVAQEVLGEKSPLLEEFRPERFA